VIEKLVKSLERQPPDLPKLDRLISIRQMGEITGWARTTLLRAESQGDIPRRKKLPNGHTAFLASEIVEWMKKLPPASMPNVNRRGGRYQ
jgi:predicted DNA-binding transcriptional regulator AlpA